MTLGDLIKALEQADPNTVLAEGFHNPHSYRGDYCDLAFEPCSDVTVGSMLAAAREAMGKTYQGYKGGDYKMDEWTPCWLSEYGCGGGEQIGPMALRYMLSTAKVTDRGMTSEALANALRDANPACESCETLSGLLVSEAEDNIQLTIENERTVDLDAFQAETIAWARATFPTTTVESTLKHLVRETREVIKDPADIVEWADCYLLLMNAAAIAGHTVSAIVEAAQVKAAVNRSRRWGAPDADGVVEHVREAPCTFDVAWVGRCSKPASGIFCPEHAALRCAGCGTVAVRSCDFSSQFVCGAPLCGACWHNEAAGYGHGPRTVAVALRAEGIRP